ncbi:MAG: phenylalanine--tRNA ligase subunit beta [Phycisphaerales bacterium]
MNISLAWLNSLLDRPVTADEAEHALTFTGFPIESRTPVVGGAGAGGDVLLDVEVTSNRGDCLSHVGVAREVAAATGRALKLPPVASGGGVAGAAAAGEAIEKVVSLENRCQEHGGGAAGGCPLFTLRLIRGVKIGPSPKWLVQRLEAVGQRSINNVVDATNCVLFELGNPSHVFDVNTIAQGSDGRRAVIVRQAAKGEKLALLDGKTGDLRESDMVVADGRAASSLAGIMGGSASGVSERTTDVLVEMATWSPGMVRQTARRLGLRTDASHRYERFVDARTIGPAMDRLVSLIVEIAGGVIAPGTLSAGLAVVPPAPITFRPDRCRAVLVGGGSGMYVQAFDDAGMERALAAQGVKVERTGGNAGTAWACTPPDHRPDLKIEEDLIEEVARTVGLDKLPVAERMSVRVKPPQSTERASRELCRVLTGMGFFEAVTFSFVSEKQARPFLPPGLTTLAVSDERRTGEGTLRPSVLPSLLACRQRNQDARAVAPGAMRLFEFASVFAQMGGGQHVEHRNLALVADLPARGTVLAPSAFEQRQNGLRLMRGIIEAALRAMRGPSGAAGLEVVAGPSPFTAIDAAASALLSLDGQPFGVMGLLTPAALAAFEIQHPVVVAEINERALLAGYPAPVRVSELPQFPAVERDLTIDVPESVAWARVERELAAHARKWCEGHAFVSTYRAAAGGGGGALGAGKKAVTMKFTFRDSTRTLRDEEVNTEMAGLVARLGVSVGATVRV